MSIRYLESRGLNRSSKVALFMKLWDIPMTEEQRQKLGERSKVTQKTSEFGNMNNAGTPYPSESCLVNRFHPDFETVIELGVRELVYAIGIDRNYITYTSCEGHDYDGTRSENDMRHVGIIARSEAEFEKAKADFENVNDIVKDKLSDTPVELALMTHSVKTDDVEMPVIDFYLAKRLEASWEDYFQAVDAATLIVLDGFGQFAEPTIQ